MNNLIGVLIRFRKENVAVMCDVEQIRFRFLNLTPVYELVLTAHDILHKQKKFFILNKQKMLD